MVDLGGHFSQLSRTLQRIHDEYHTPVEVVELAREAGMNLSVFHLRFKQMTSTSPAPYIKAVRLQNARFMMLRSKLTGGAASAEVGSQKSLPVPTISHRGEPENFVWKRI
jgi:transcriptional regulator GlxA family with amidase domain